MQVNVGGRAVASDSFGPGRRRLESECSPRHLWMLLLSRAADWAVEEFGAASC